MWKMIFQSYILVASELRETLFLVSIRDIIKKGRKKILLGILLQ